MNDEFNKIDATPESETVDTENIPQTENRAEETVAAPETEAKVTEEHEAEASQEPVAPVDDPERTVELPSRDSAPSEATQEIPAVKAEQVQPPENPIYTTQPYTNAPRPVYPNPPAPPRPAYNYPVQGYGSSFRPANTPPAYVQPQRVAPPQQAVPPQRVVQPQQTIQAPAAPKKKRTGLKVFIIIMAIILAFTFGIGLMAIFGGIFNPNSNNPGNATPEAETTANYATDNDGAPGINIQEPPVTVPETPSPDGTLTPAQIASKVKPSIVGIVVYTRNSNRSAGEGTGVVMGEDASSQYTYIITCAHVISDPGISVKVQTEDGTTYDAQIVGIDTRTDLGVLRINATGLPAAEFGNSDALQVGDSVYAIGNPGGVEFFGSFTGGFVSAIDRPVSSEIGYTMKCIQHDAAINPGNSGGALVNSYGQVIGINSQKIAATDYEGMGFAIPISSAKSVVESLINYNYVPNRPKLGITYYPVSASERYSMIAQIKGLPAGTLIIDEISEDGALANTEVRPNDLITAVDGKPLTHADVLLEKVDNGKVGDKMVLTICRINSDYTIREFDVEITLVEDKGSSVLPSQTPDGGIDPFDYFN